MSRKHAHKYQRLEWGKNKTLVYRCMISGCSHYLHPEFLIGRKAQCWKCESEFTINKKHLSRVKLTCGECQRNVVEGEDIDKIVADLIKNL